MLPPTVDHRMPTGGSRCAVSKETALSTQVDITNGWCVGRRHRVAGPARGGIEKGNLGKGE